MPHSLLQWLQMKKLIPWLSLVFLAIVTIILFRKFFLAGLLPIPYDIMVGWYYPYNFGGWQDYSSWIPFKGGLFAADVFRQMIPWKHLVLDQIRSGQLPLWNPYAFSGEPLLANPQAFVFYPLSFIFFLIPNFDLAWSWYIFASPLLTAGFMFFFLRSLKLSALASILGGLAFALSGHMISWLEWGVVTHTALWLPLSLLALRLWLLNRHRLALPLLIFSIFSTITGGYPQPGAYSLLLTSCYFLFLIYQTRPTLRTLLPRLLTISITLLILTLPQTVPTLKLFSHSALKGDTSEQLFLNTRLHPRHLLTIFAPDYFGNRIFNDYWANSFTQVDYIDANLFIGSIALIFILYSLYFFRHHSSDYRFFLFTTLTSLALALSSPLTRFLAYLQLPLISTGVAAGVLYLTVFSLSVISAFG